MGRVRDGRLRVGNASRTFGGSDESAACVGLPSALVQSVRRLCTTKSAHGSERVRFQLFSFVCVLLYGFIYGMYGFWRFGFRFTSYDLPHIYHMDMCVPAGPARRIRLVRRTVL